MVGRKGGTSGGATGHVRVTWEWARSVVIAVLLFLAVRAFVVEAFKIPTSSMEGTLLVGDYLLVNKAVYGTEVPLLGLRLPAWREPGPWRSRGVPSTPRAAQELRQTGGGRAWRHVGDAGEDAPRERA